MTQKVASMHQLKNDIKCIVNGLSIINGWICIQLTSKNLNEMLDTSITCKTYSNNINKILPSYTRGGCRNDLNTMLKQKMYAEICPTDKTLVHRNE